MGAIQGETARTQTQEQVQERLQETEQRLELLREEGKPIPTLPSFGKPKSGENETGQGVGGQQQGGPAPVQIPAGGRP